MNYTELSLLSIKWFRCIKHRIPLVKLADNGKLEHPHYLILQRNTYEENGEKERRKPVFVGC